MKAPGPILAGGSRSASEEKPASCTLSVVQRLKRAMYGGFVGGSEWRVRKAGPEKGGAERVRERGGKQEDTGEEEESVAQRSVTHTSVAAALYTTERIRSVNKDPFATLANVCRMH